MIMSNSKQRRLKKRKVQRQQKRVQACRCAAEKNLGLPLRARVIAEVQRLSIVLGFTMEGRLLDGGADHWMFSDGAYRLLNYWPTNGRWYDSNTGHKGIERDITEVLAMAETIFNERKKQ